MELVHWVLFAIFMALAGWKLFQRWRASRAATRRSPR
jgi:hypothetical protein